MHELDMQVKGLRQPMSLHYGYHCYDFSATLLSPASCVVPAVQGHCCYRL